MSVNKVILVGNVGNDPEVQYVQTDVPVAKFSLATNESYKKDGERITNTEWHNIVVWRGLAKVVEQYVRKGTKLYIEGKISTRSYEKDGVTKYFTEIICRDLKMLDSNPNAENKTGSKTFESKPSKQTQSQNTPPSHLTNDVPASYDMPAMEEIDDLPF